MSAARLKRARKSAGLTQQQAAGKLGVSQAYLSMLERGARPLRPKLGRRLADLYGVPAEPPPLDKRSRFTWSEDAVARQLGNLGYPGFAYLRSGRRKNPAELLGWALAQEVLDARLARALPWVVLHYDQALDWKWLCNQAKLTDSQNRLGFVVWLSRQLSERHGDTSKANRLRQVEQALEGSRLLREGTFFEQVRSEGMKNWLRERQSPEAKHWRVLTEFRPERVRHAY